MKRLQIMLTIVLTTLALFCQPGAVRAYSSEVTEAIGAYIQTKDLDGARKKANEYLAKDPENIDAIMMMGNVVLNEYMKDAAGIHVSSNSNESIYDDRIGYISEPVTVLPREVAKEVASYWLKSLSLDNSREDIHKGVCYLYAMALMKAELLERFPLMKAALPGERDTLMYNMGDYAGMFLERDQFEEAMEVYEAILKLYPNHTGILSDVAGIHFKEGDVGVGVSYIRRALTQEGLDEMSLENGVIMLTVAGDHEGALDAYRRMSELKGNGEWLLYRGLMGLVDEKKDWRKDLEACLKKGPGAAKGMTAFLLSSEYKEDFDGWSAAMGKEAPTWFHMLLARYAVKKFPNKPEALFSLGDMMTYYRNYGEAIPVLESLMGLADRVPPERNEWTALYLAWALQDSGEAGRADKLWVDLMDSEEIYIKSAAAYFYGKNLLLTGKEKEALKVFRTVEDRASESKYATLCWNGVEAIENGRMPFFVKVKGRAPSGKVLELTPVK